MQTYRQLSITRFASLIPVAVCFLVTSNWAFAQQSVFDEEVIGKWKAYEEFSRSLQGTARGRGTLLNGKPRLSLDHYKQNRECACFSKGMSEPPFETWVISNPRYAASIKRSKENPADVVLLKYEEDRNATIIGGLFSVVDRIFWETSHHFSCCGVPLTELVSKPEFSAKIVGKESHDGRDLIRVDYDYVYVNKKSSTKTIMHGSAYLDPSRCWCVYQDKGTRQTTAQAREWEDLYDNRYETIDHPSGFPLLKRWIYNTKRGLLKQQKPKQENGTAITDYEWEINDHVPNDEFTLSAFGLPEPGSDTVIKKSMPTYVWILLGAAICALLAMGFRYAARRRSALQSI